MTTTNGDRDFVSCGQPKPMRGTITRRDFLNGAALALAAGATLSPRDLWAMERAAVFRGLYHVLGGTLSAIDGRGPSDLNIDRLLTRAGQEVSEVILALPATVEGQTTAHYLHERLSPLPVEVTRLAHGVPVGGELDFLDDGTLAQALKARAKLGGQ